MILVHLAGATLLLLYSVRMVRTGVERAAGPSLRRAITGKRHNPFSALLLGLAAAICLQGSTGALLLASGFAASGLLALNTGLALLLGADIGSALVVQVLTFKLGWLVPVLLAIGGWLFLKFESRTVRQTGRILLGIAFTLISLRMIGEATAPLKDASLMPVIAKWLDGDYITAYIAGTALAFLLHSTVATILLISAFVLQGALGMDAGISMLLGANLGGGLIGVWLTRGMEMKGRILPAGNLVFRAFGTVAALVLLRFVELPLAELGSNAARQLVNLHLAFNTAMALACLPFAGPLAALLANAMPDKAVPDIDGEWQRPTSALDRSLINTPHLALASATREVLRMAQLLEVMIRPVMDLFQTGNRMEIDRLRKLDREVNTAHTGIKLYIAEVNRGELSRDDADRGMDLAGFAINLERAGDITKNLLGLAVEKNKKQQKFSDDGWRELTDLHARVMTNMQLALNVLLSEDLDSARQLIMEKDQMRVLERESRKSHMARLKTGTQASIGTSDLHLETVRSLREINSLFSAAAFPIVARHGQLRDSRLMKNKTSRAK